MASFSANQAGPSRKFLAVTPSNTSDLPAGCRSLYVGATGDVRVADDDGNISVFASVPAGTTLPIGPTRVYVTGTTATGIIALY